MPITLTTLDDRRFDDLVEEALGRASVHTPEWTNLNRSDPGVTLVEVFAFLTETLLYRANQIPDRNRRKFLQLLRIPLETASAAQGLVTITNAAPSPNPLPVILPDGVEVRAGQVPFRTSRPLDVLPVEARFYIKRRIDNPSADIRQYYQQLYASYRGTAPEIDPDLYEAVPFPTADGTAVDLADTIDNAVWLALLVRALDTTLTPDNVRRRIANGTLSLGVVPSLEAADATLPAGRTFGATANVTLKVDAPKVPDSGGLPADPSQRVAEYQPLAVKADGDVFTIPGIVDISLPSEQALRLWNNLDPLEAGVGGLPPAIDDESVDGRVVTWLRISPSAATSAKFQWMGINTVPVTQRARVISELLPAGTGEPDQIVRLALAPVLAETVRITVTTPTTPQGDSGEWKPIDDLSAAPAEVRVPDPKLPPGSRSMPQPADSTASLQPDPSHVYALNAESGEVRFGDGARGARPADGATIRASYDYALGAQGNVSAGQIITPSSLPEGFKVVNPIDTWGGADAEPVDEGEKQIARYLQHRDRLVTADDFRTIVLRTPGVSIGRVEVLPTYHPDFGGAEVPGAVTLMLVPSYDALQPDAPLPRTPFLDAICRYLDPRRLVTTEVVLRGPDYVGVWISIGVKVAAGFNDSQVRAAVEHDIRTFLGPTSGGVQTLPDDPAVLLGASTPAANGWKLGKAVVALELAAVANRTIGVEFVQQDVLLADPSGSAVARVEMTGLQLPRVLGISVTSGAPLPLDALRGTPSGGVTQTPRVVQVPVIPEECR
ncbi:MAG TPA: baseplate J/gp47 family protein [Vicinamibacterales bacterium]